MSPQIDKEYIQTGKIRWVFRNFAFLSQDSLFAAEATYCAGEQDKFWPLHDKLYLLQSTNSAVSFSKENLKRYAAEVGLNEQTFNTCLDTSKYASQVSKDAQYAQAQGVGGTPTFLVNGRAVNVMDRDPQTTIRNFRAILDAELNK